MDPRHYCQPLATAPYCTTATWQYSTEDDAGARTSHWVGIRRGCATADSSAGAEVAATAGANRAATDLKENLRFYAPANTAAKAKDNARFPTSDSANNIAVTTGKLSTFTFTGAATINGANDFLSPLDPQFMTSDGTGAPDLPTTLVTPELECISCVTPIGNTDSTVSLFIEINTRVELTQMFFKNTCVTAKSTGRVKCKTLSCNSVTSAFKLSADGKFLFYLTRFLHFSWL